MQAFSRPTGELARAVPHRDPDLLYYRVVTHGPDDRVGVCDETGERVPLSTADLIMWEVDRVAVHRAMAMELGLVADPQPLEHLSNTWRLGQYAPLAGYRFPAVWTVQAGEVELTQVIDRLVAMYDGPFLLVAPTGRFLRPWGEELLRRRQACFLPLDEAVALGDDGQLAATAARERMLAAFRDRRRFEPHSGGENSLPRMDGWFLGTLRNTYDLMRRWKRWRRCSVCVRSKTWTERGQGQNPSPKEFEI